MCLEVITLGDVDLRGVLLNSEIAFTQLATTDTIN